MKAIERLKELRNRIELTPSGYKGQFTEDELLEYRMLQTIANIMSSRTDGSHMSKDVLKLLVSKSGIDIKGFKKGQFFY